MRFEEDRGCAIKSNYSLLASNVRRMSRLRLRWAALIRRWNKNSCSDIYFMHSVGAVCVWNNGLWQKIAFLHCYSTNSKLLKNFSLSVVFFNFSLSQRHDMKTKFRSNAPLISLRCLYCFRSFFEVKMK